MLCHTCTHPAGAHAGETGRCSDCGCILYIRPDTPRARLRNVARNWGWTVRESDHLDAFYRGETGFQYVQVIYAADVVFGVNTPLAYYPAAPDVAEVATAALTH